MKHFKKLIVEEVKHFVSDTIKNAYNPTSVSSFMSKNREGNLCEYAMMTKRVKELADDRFMKLLGKELVKTNY
jgi:hypothetical protein